MEQGAWAFDKQLDVELLYELYGDDTEHAKMVFDEFLKTAPVMMKEMEESYQKNVIEDFRKQVHKMKPVFSFVGLSLLTKRAETLEYKCSESLCMDDLSELYGDLKSHYNKYFPIVRDEANRLENQQ